MMIRYSRPSQVRDLLSDAQKTQSLLAMVRYGEVCISPDNDGGRAVTIAMPYLCGESWQEVWTSQNVVSIHRDGELKMAEDGDLLFGSIQVAQAHDSSLEKTTYLIYQRILREISQKGYAHLVRMWNYFPAINAKENGQERYQCFCMGRHQAFAEHQEEFQATLPAASAVGTRSGDIHVYFLAGKTKGVHVENPRQISAYHYPKLYGPRSPSFARGTVYTLKDQVYFFAAGTASIVGHATQHLNDPVGQTVETLSNLDALVHHAKKEHQDVLGPDLSLSLLKVYIRNSQETDSVRTIVEDHVGKDVATLYLQGDMCRKDLLVEIEAIFVNIGRE